MTFTARRFDAASRGDGTCRSFDATTLAEGPWVDLGRNADNLRYSVSLANMRQELIAQTFSL